VLERAGHEVLEARDGGEAVVLAGEWRPELAILDVKMPVLDGVEAARRINAAAPLAIVLLTAYADEGTVRGPSAQASSAT
jgi:response regulator NasT